MSGDGGPVSIIASMTAQVGDLLLFRHARTAGRFFRVGMFGVLVGACANMVSAEHSAQQQFQVTVPVSSTVSVPDQEVVIDDMDQGTGEFPEQIWKLVSSSPTGVVADFTVSSGFKNVADPSIEYDAGLKIRVVQSTGQGQWITTEGNAATNHSGGVSQAGVQVQADAPGQADLALQVLLLDDFENMTAGTYSMTVTCTISIR